MVEGNWMNQDDSASRGKEDGENFSSSRPERDRDHSDDGSDTDAEEIVRLHGELQDAKEQAEKHKDQYLRTLAETENYRRRVEREKSELIKFSNESIIKDFIPMIDSFDKALSQLQAQEGGESQGSHLHGYLEGVRLVKQQFEDVLAKHGLSPVEAVGKRFDPNLHQAIQKIESSAVEYETVHQEFSKGYLLNGRLIRPSMVSVHVPAGDA